MEIKQRTLCVENTLYNASSVCRAAQCISVEIKGLQQKGNKIVSDFTFNVLASSFFPANMDFSSKCIGKALEEESSCLVLLLVY